MAPLLQSKSLDHLLSIVRSLDNHNALVSLVKPKSYYKDPTASVYIYPSVKKDMLLKQVQNGYTLLQKYVILPED
jgi:hypothetical protein